MTYIQHLKVMVGSRAYGFVTPESDMDLRGVCWSGTLDHLLGFDSFELIQPATGDDETYESMKKFLTLLVEKCSFCHLDTLWAPTDCLVEADEWGRTLMRERYKLIGAEKLACSGVGFARGQHHFVKRHTQEERHKRHRTTTMVEGYDKRLRKAQHHGLRILWQVRYCLLNNVWPVRVADFDPAMHNLLFDIKQHGMPFEEWHELFDSMWIALDLAAESTTLPTEPDRQYWSDFLTRYHTSLVKTLQATN
jgi:predicted nucleotidyltransferase